MRRKWRKEARPPPGRMFRRFCESCRPQVKQCVWSIALSRNCPSGASSLRNTLLRLTRGLPMLPSAGKEYRSQFSVQVSNTTSRLMSCGLISLCS